MFILPDWPAPSSVGAVMSTRLGGHSRAPFDSLNLRSPSEASQDPDDPAALAANRDVFARAVEGAEPVWLKQVHGRGVVQLTRSMRAGAAVPIAVPVVNPSSAPSGDRVNDPVHDPEADASISCQPHLACVVRVADCLPVLFCDRRGRGVAAAHAGWRGLAAGVLDGALQALCRASGASAHELLAWLGPCIGPQAFEVGAEVREAFGADHDIRAASRFTWAPRPDGQARWRADLAGLATDRLVALGMAPDSIHASGLCTVSDPSRFFSFRRDGLTGRMAAAVWLR